MQNYKNAQWIAQKTPDGKKVLNPKDNIRVEIDGIPCQVGVDESNRHYGYNECRRQPTTPSKIPPKRETKARIRNMEHTQDPKYQSY